MHSQLLHRCRLTFGCHRDGWTPLQLATTKNHVDAARLLLENGAFVNEKSEM